MPGPSSAADTASQQFAWDQANARLAAAHAPAEFAEAASLYRNLILDGLRSGPAFYNYAVALEKAEQHADAARTFLRAERYLGTTDDIRQGLLVALSNGKPEARVLLPWQRVFLFWHYGLDMSLRLTLASSSFALLWLALALRLWGARNLARRIHMGALAGLIIFGSSVLASLHAEDRDQAREVALAQALTVAPHTEKPSAPAP